MKWFRRRPKPATDLDVDMAHAANNWREAMIGLWSSIDDMPTVQRPEWVVEAQTRNGDFWNMEPALWEALTRRWPEAWKGMR